jgi:hypothetical protein
VESSASGSQFLSCGVALTMISTVPSSSTTRSLSVSSPVDAIVPSLAYRLAFEPMLKYAMVPRVPVMR